MNCAWKELTAMLPLWLQKELEKADRHSLQEIRIRSGQPTLLINRGNRRTPVGIAQRQDLYHILNMACRYSPWTAETVAQGYITVPGGHRIGLCGQAIIRQGKMCGIGELTSMNIRVCHDFPGVSGNLWLHEGSILIIGPPGSGKTTLLRDLVRRRSQRETMAVIDQRGEIFPPAADFYRGENTDVLTGCDKKSGMDLLLRVMGPQCIAVDEITAGEDCSAMIRAGKCGVSVIATAHAASVDELQQRPVYRQLLSSGLFQWAVILGADQSRRTERMVKCESY